MKVTRVVSQTKLANLHLNVPGTWYYVGYMDYEV